MRVAVRADASVEIGTGHVMRCLTLADALREGGAECSFLCRRHDGHLLDLIAARGHRAVGLPLREAGTAVLDPDAPAHARWLGTDWIADAEDSRKALADASMDWLIVDHYALDRRWEQAMRPGCRQLLVLDDLADRPHDCDLLLDQNLGRRAGDYDDLLPPGVQTLIGPRYALLRPEFAALRAESLARRENPKLGHLLVTMGGVDKDNATGVVLDALDACDLPPDLRITVVLGPHAPFQVQVRAQAEMMSRPTRVLAGVSDMAALMSNADLAIGAAGGSAWERCCLGLPSLLLVIADNQSASAATLDASGAAVLLGDFRQEGWRKQLAAALAGLSDAARRQAVAEGASRVTDGRGATRVAQAMSGLQLAIRPATPDDAEAIWEWRHAGGASRFYRETRATPLGEHLAWFARALRDPSRLLLVVTGPSGPFAHVRLDLVDGAPAEAEIAICLSETTRGRGLSGPALELALEHAAASGVRRFTAAVHKDNAGSVKLFSALGFVQDGRDGPFLHFSREAETGAGRTPGE